MKKLINIKMSQIPLDNFDNIDKEIIKKVNKILSIPETDLNSTDKKFIDFLRYIFWIDFRESNFTLPKRKKEKYSYQYLQYYIEILFKIFQKNKNEREILYKEKRPFKDEFSSLFQSLKSLIDDKKIISLNAKNSKDKIIYFMYKYFHKLSNTFSIYITLYFFGIYFFLPRINTPNLLLYYLLKENFPQILEGLNYQEFCSDFDSNNCLDFIQLFFYNFRDKKYDIAKIYAYLIFKYKEIFIHYNKEIEIDFTLIQKVVSQIVEKVKSNNINDKELGKFIKSNFFNYLENNTKIEISDNSQDKSISLKEKEKNNEINNSQGNKITKITCINNIDDNNKIINNKNEIKESSNDQTVGENTINIKRENIRKEKKNSPHLKSNMSIPDEKSEKGFINGSTEIKSSTNENEDISQNKFNPNEIIEEEEEKDFINNSIQISNNDNNLALKKIKELEKNIALIKNEKDEKIKLLEKNIALINNEKAEEIKELKKNIASINNEKSEEIKELKSIVKTMKSNGEQLIKENNSRKISIEKVRKENNILKNKINIIREENGELKSTIKTMQIENKKKDNELITHKNKINKNIADITKLKASVKEIKTALGSIQVRDYAKNFLNQFTIILTEDDRINIEKDKSKKWEIILNRAVKIFLVYKCCSNYNSIIKIFQDDINNIAKKNNILIPNSESNKLFFLLQLGISNNNL